MKLVELKAFPFRDGDGDGKVVVLREHFYCMNLKEKTKMETKS